ncbi:hypothetical protein EDI_182640 [Entamoeba dispar SAW760]|uniref:Uncharacterized protein n=1 Tax=Entamoeba dispar (strain ATCC PRA-260 / SAW760) TaxID=370354 RepID=B0EQ20_ENTDS|nr:uncharacterized protein EDI_182640 [Entamoeba dispar SAW760]EDR23367.1 hypothetical protein EDI_182640 [Entamoeba dispar SAW760]|eukprot:EDR23367.1 hypothetical protein EDI_182640 [Entamoeba dispar SAW760]
MKYGRFHFNLIPLNDYSRKFFPNIETFHIYNKYDERVKDGRIIASINIQTIVMNIWNYFCEYIAFKLINNQLIVHGID